MTELKVADLKKHLKMQDQKELIRIITDLSKLSKEAKAYLAVEVYGEDAVPALYDEAKKAVKEEFFPAKGHGRLRLAKAKKAISDFRKLSGDPVQSVDLLLFYVEIGTEFTAMYGDISESFYNSMESVFQQVADECEKDEAIYVRFRDRMQEVVEMAQPIGWGYPDALEDILYSIGWIEEEE